VITATRTPPAVVRRLPGLADYVGTWETMQRFTATRDATTADEVWLLEHPPVYTLGLNGDPAHVLGAGAIPVVRTDRGGQVTFHGPGQLVVYLLMDIARAQLGIRDVVTGLERAVIELAAGFGIEATARRDAPGVYVRGAKLASIGLRVRHGATYHGMALNVAMDLAPFQQINPCGHAGLGVTQLRELGGPADVDTAAARLLPHLMPALGLSPAQMSPA
jgi:lipoyl(octanoyl) transferase